MLRFLDPDWITALDDAASRSGALCIAAVSGRLVVEQVVSVGAGAGAAPDRPGDEVRYHLVLDPGPPPTARVRPGAAEDPDLVLRTDYEAAAALARGAINAQEAIAGGRCRIRGRLDLLTTRREALVALGDVFATVRASTEFPART